MRGHGAGQGELVQTERQQAARVVGARDEPHRVRRHGAQRRHDPAVQAQPALVVEAEARVGDARERRAPGDGAAQLRVRRECGMADLGPAAPAAPAAAVPPACVPAALPPAGALIVMHRCTECKHAHSRRRVSGCESPKILGTADWLQ